MNNPRITAKERNLIKGAIRRVFSRSTYRTAIVLMNRVLQYTDPKRPRVKKWSKCPLCDELTPTYLMQVDHIDPIVPIGTTLEDMSWDDVIDRIWCDQNNLQSICKVCHNIKSKEENKQRRLNKKEKKIA